MPMEVGASIIRPNEELDKVPSPGMAESTNAVGTTGKYRGPSRLVTVHARTLNERPMIILNMHEQPIGPSQSLVLEFSRFLGTIAKNPSLAPLNYISWPSLPTHDEIWQYVLEKYLVAEESLLCL